MSSSTSPSFLAQSLAPLAKDTYPPTSYAASLTTPSGDIAELTYDPLDEGDRIQRAIDRVRRDDAGAVAVFLGTTRDGFQGKRVTRLEYHAYTPLAMKTLSKILDQSHTLHPSSTSQHHPRPPPSLPETQTPPQTQNTNTSALTKSIIIHRLGSVPVGQTSIIIAVSSPHRREAFEVCEWMLERVKGDVQVWKREWYGVSASVSGEGGDGDGDGDGRGEGEGKRGEDGSQGEGGGGGEAYEGKVDGDEEGPYVAKDGQAGGLEREVGAMWKANH